jgi:hypothetical protein
MPGYAQAVSFPINYIIIRQHKLGVRKAQAIATDMPNGVLLSMLQGVLSKLLD